MGTRPVPRRRSQPEGQVQGAESEDQHGAERHHLAVRKVGEPGGAEDQGQAHRGKGQQQAEAKAGHKPVEEVLAEVLLLHHDALAEGEDDREV